MTLPSGQWSSFRGQCSAFLEEAVDVHVVVKGRNMEITPALKEHAEERLAKLRKYFDKVDESVVTCGLERKRHIADVTIHAGGLVFRGEERSTDMYSSIDTAVEKIERQLLRFKGKVFARTRASHPQLAGPPEGSEEEPAPAAAASDAAPLPRIVRTKRFALKPMSPEEAVLQLELLNHGFYVFENADTQQINVLYRRHHGNYGLIEPEP